MARILAQEQDTIAAIATGQGGGIGMVRLSGPESLAVAGRVFFPRDRGRQVEAMGGYTGAYGSGNNIMVGATIFSGVNVNRYICCTCGYTEEWIDKEDMEKVKSGKRTHRV